MQEVDSGWPHYYGCCPFVAGQGLNWNLGARRPAWSGERTEDSNATGVNGDQTNNKAQNSGAAYVFVREGINWTQQAYLKASNTGGPSPGDDEGDGDGFGNALGISGDTIVVAANGEDSIATGVNGDQANNSVINPGAAYVFVRDGTNWSQQAYLKASILLTPLGGEFGQSLSIAGDTIVVATGGDSSNATGINGDQTNHGALLSGAAFVFMRNGTNWSQQAYVKASNTAAEDEFGFGNAVAVSGGTVVVGAIGEDSNATGVNGNQSNNSSLSSGAVYVFSGVAVPALELAIEQFFSEVRLLWPLSAADFVLDESDILNASPTTAWTQVPFPYQTSATEISVLLPQSAGNKFYRLRKP